MEVRELERPSEFVERATPLLLADEPRHNLLFGISSTLVTDPSRYEEFRLWTVEDAGEVVCAALMTPPFNVVVARPAKAGVLDALAEGLREEGVAPPGVTAAVPEAGDFADAWCRVTGATRQVRMAQRIYALRNVRRPPPPPGAPRRVTMQDRELLIAWLDAFDAEAGVVVRDSAAVVDSRLTSATDGFDVWEDGEPVCLVGHGGPTPNGIRIGPVYTPPEHRRRGYASALTAEVSDRQLRSGRTFCFLYTDLSNPTSNSVYMRIGYEPVCDSAEYEFVYPARS